MSLEARLEEVVAWLAMDAFAHARVALYDHQEIPAVLGGPALEFARILKTHT